MAFFKWILDNNQLDPESLKRLRSEMRYFGLRILPPLVNASEGKVLKKEGAITLPISFILGLSIKTQRLIAEREEKESGFNNLTEVLSF